MKETLLLFTFYSVMLKEIKGDVGMRMTSAEVFYFFVTGGGHVENN